MCCLRTTATTLSVLENGGRTKKPSCLPEAKARLQNRIPRNRVVELESPRFGQAALPASKWQLLSYRLTIVTDELIDSRLRRIKCDEGKPFCGRCTSTGRRCDGYALKRHGSQIGSRARATAFPPVSVIIKFVYPSTVPHLPLSYPGGTPEELRSLEFFRNNTASKLSKWMTGSFWKVQLPQTGFYEPSIRHSMIAMASIHEEMERISESCIPDPMCYASSEARQHYAAQHAQMALSELSKLLAARPEATEVALINCILFVMLDFMAGKFASK